MFSQENSTRIQKKDMFNLQIEYEKTSRQLIECQSGFWLDFHLNSEIGQSACKFAVFLEGTVSIC